MKKKVLFVITKSNWGGAQRYVFDVATHLPEGFEALVALGGTGEKDAQVGLLASTLERTGIRTIHINSFMRTISLRYELQTFFELVGIYRKEKPDVVHLNSSKAGGLGALAARVARVPIIVFTSHGLAYEEDRNSVFRALAFLATWTTFLFATNIIAISKPNYESIRRLWRCASKVQLIHNGIAPLTFVPKEEGRAILSSRTFSSPSKEAVWIGCIAEYTQNKGLSYLIKAACALHATQPLYLFCIGEGKERNHLADCIKKEHAGSYIYLCGFMPDAYTYMPSFDIIALPSLKEGLPYTLIEAGQAGNAVVASAVGGIPDIIEDGVSGLLCNAKDVSALTEKLRMLVTDTTQRELYGRNLQQKVADQFSLTNMVDRTVEIYSTLS